MRVLKSKAKAKDAPITEQVEVEVEVCSKRMEAALVDLASYVRRDAAVVTLLGCKGDIYLLIHEGNRVNVTRNILCLFPDYKTVAKFADYGSWKWDLASALHVQRLEFTLLD